MRKIVIVSRKAVELGTELFESISCLREAGIAARSAVIALAYAVVWVDDDEVYLSVDLLRKKGFGAAMIQTDEPS